MTSLVRPAMASVSVRTTSVAVRARRVTPVAFVDRSPSTTVTRGAGTLAVFTQRSGSRTAARNGRVAVRVHAAKGETAADPNAALGPNKSAADAVNNGLACFQMRKYDQAVANFTAALENFGTPTEDESRAALYNRACANVKLQKYVSSGDHDGMAGSFWDGELPKFVECCLNRRFRTRKEMRLARRAIMMIVRSRVRAWSSSVEFENVTYDIIEPPKKITR